MRLNGVETVFLIPSMEDVNQRTPLPLFRRGKSKVSLEGDLSDQLRCIAQESGDRNQL